MHSIINSNDVNHCSTLAGGLLNKKIVLSFGQKKQSGKSYETYSNYQDYYVFNLNSLNELRLSGYLVMLFRTWVASVLVKKVIGCCALISTGKKINDVINSKQ